MPGKEDPSSFVFEGLKAALQVVDDEIARIKEEKEQLGIHISVIGRELDGIAEELNTLFFHNDLSDRLEAKRISQTSENLRPELSTNVRDPIPQDLLNHISFTSIAVVDKTVPGLIYYGKAFITHADLEKIIDGTFKKHKAFLIKYSTLQVNHTDPQIIIDTLLHDLENQKYSLY